MPKKTKSPKTKKHSDSSASNILPFPRREAMEGAFSGILGGKTRAVDETQDIMYDAWEAPTRMPRTIPFYCGFGDTNEAVIYADDCLRVSPSP
ncbi:hypothetical protein [Candidatus Magnetominusculus xianensis]|uniref:Uncharacterized protein n=1 Tax=Candidatus Magnetominusculus xianensis TaxID=1748249 RepID=A0ABR5SIA3_9BACT|nr:hypothetical protein [Candidatus Magnetominusculus xianensis]KWT92154.1 hypothetical protein ASN18_0557 [Candidatus Magnetominusculus xianensis]